MVARANIKSIQTKDMQSRSLHDFTACGSLYSKHLVLFCVYTDDSKPWIFILDMIQLVSGDTTETCWWIRWMGYWTGYPSVIEQKFYSTHFKWTVLIFFCLVWLRKVIAEGRIRLKWKRSFNWFAAPLLFPRFRRHWKGGR